jgi:hypothetical protein
VEVEVGTFGATALGPKLHPNPKLDIPGLDQVQMGKEGDVAGNTQI